ncbi:MAG: AAA family ATPase [Chromatiales bacterium]|nr:AAA family ATPase [Chromatiales bacterium]
MYAAHFELREPPFAITPDPAYVYLSRHHREALAHLLYGTSENGGFVQLTGEVGTGKTTLVRTLLEQRLENVDIALCLNPPLTVEELLATVCDELGAAYPREPHTLKPLLDALNEHLLRTHAAGRRTVLIIDEAQNLSREVLEQVRLLTNLETAKHKLLRIILVGQPELRRLLARPDLRQLAQRITARYHLPPLDSQETAAYIRHRLRVAGGHVEWFTGGALRTINRRSCGIPRLINIICDRAMLGAFSQNARRISAGIVRQAARETLQGGPAPAGRALHPWLALGVGLAGLAGLAVIGGGLWLSRTDPTPTVASASPVHQSHPPIRAKPAGPVRRPWPSRWRRHHPPAPTHPIWPHGYVRPPATTPTTVCWRSGASLNPTGKAPFCEQVKAHNLRCLADRGDWDALRRFDHPAVLRLMLPGGIPAPTLLRSLVGDMATLVIAGRPVTVPLAQLTSAWTGHYLLLWRPQVDQRVIGPGNTGESRTLAAPAAGPGNRSTRPRTAVRVLRRQPGQAIARVSAGARPATGWDGGRTHAGTVEQPGTVPGTPVLRQPPREP